MTTTVCSTLCNVRRYYSGQYRITGTVTELGVVGAYRVRLYERHKGMQLLETWSDNNGQYVFNYLEYIANFYFVIAHDHSSPQYNAAIADLVTPEPIP